MVAPVRVGDRLIGPGAPCCVIAEAGVNHDGDRDSALQLVDAAADAGADFVKFQTFRADALCTDQAPQADYQTRNTRTATSQREMLRRLELSRADHAALMERCRVRGIGFLSSPFDEESLALLLALGVEALKIPSGEITNTPFLETLGRTGLPLVLSTGMSTLEEVTAAVEAIRSGGEAPLVLLHCVSAYPAPVAESNLRAMQTLARVFSTPVGFSDHTDGSVAALGAVALGASAIEKHLTLDRGRPGPDHVASVEPAAFADFVAAIRLLEAALGDGVKRPTPAEADAIRVARKSLIARRDIAAGETITAEILALRRPGTGLPPARLAEVVGRTARRAIPAGTLLGWDLLA